MSLYAPTKAKRVLFFLLADALLSFISLILAYELRFNFSIPYEFEREIFIVFFTLLGLKLISLWFFRLYFTAWRFFGLYDAKRLFFALLASYAIFWVGYELFLDDKLHFSRGILVIDFFLSFTFLGTLRISKRIFMESRQKDKINNTAIIGANAHTANIIKNALSGELDYYPLVIFESETQYINTYISNLRVYPLSELEKKSKELGIESVIICKNLNHDELNAIYERLEKLDILNVKIATLLEEKKEALKDVSIEDLLARTPKDLDSQVIATFIKNKRVLITGAGGSIGSEISRQCATFGASELIFVDNSEYNLYKIADELENQKKFSYLISVTNREKLDEVFVKHAPELVIHCAAYKHVPLCEENIVSAVENNIIGTMNTIDTSIKYGVKKVVIVSTDKAVRPTNVMGATKRVGELYAQNIKSGETEIVSVRFGNVLGSSGSVVPKFKEQIMTTGVITVTHPEIRRYFMLIPEACKLVLQAGAIARGGEIFILDMGEPVKIVDLAQKMIKLYKKPARIEFVGLRAGEKLYEELLIDESERKTKYESIHVARSTHYEIESLKRDIEELLKTDKKTFALKKIVPEFTHYTLGESIA